MEYKVIIQGRLIGLNEYIAAERANRYKAAKMKRENEAIVMIAIKQQLKNVKIEKPVYMEYTWVEKNKRRDLDNITFGRKIVQDSLVKAGILKNDGWKYILGFSDRFEVEQENPRIEVVIKEVEKN